LAALAEADAIFPHMVMFTYDMYEMYLYDDIFNWII